jgi:tetratricopeptide (TPR) repeat protein
MRNAAAFRCLLTASLAAALAGGCSGHGRYTREHINAAQEKMSVLKAGTEWQQAHQAFLAGDLEKALRSVDASLSINDTVVKSHVLRGRILMEMGDVGAGLSSLLTAEALDPNDVDAQYFLGIAHERLLEREKAVAHYKKACELDGYNPSYGVAAAEMLMDMERFDEAEAWLTSGPNFQHSAGVKQALGHIAMIRGDARAAADFFGDAALLAPDDDAIAEDLVRAQIRAESYVEAEQILARLLRSPDNAERRDLLQMRARCLAAIDRPVEARDIYQKLLSMQDGTNDVDAWIGVGKTSMTVGDDRTARRAAARVVSLAPNRPEGYAIWASWHRENGDLDKALSSAERAVTAAPNDPAMHALRGVVLSDMGRIADADNAFRAAARLDATYAAFVGRPAGSFANVPTE